MCVEYSQIRGLSKAEEEQTEKMFTKAIVTMLLMSCVLRASEARYGGKCFGGCIFERCRPVQDEVAPSEKCACEVKYADFCHNCPCVISDGCRAVSDGAVHKKVCQPVKKGYAFSVECRTEVVAKRCKCEGSVNVNCKSDVPRLAHPSNAPSVRTSRYDAGVLPHIGLRRAHFGNKMSAVVDEDGLIERLTQINE